MRRNLIVLLAAGVLVLGTAGHAATVVTLQEGLEYSAGNPYGGTADTWSVASGGRPFGNAGAFQTSDAMRDHGRNSLLLRFAGLDAVLGGLGVTDKSQITEAKVQLYVTATAYDPTKVDLYTWRMTHDWEEGSVSSSYGDFSSVDGANNVTYNGPRLGSDQSWTQHGTHANIEYTAVTSQPSVFFKNTTYHNNQMAEVAFDTDLDTTLATVNATSNSWYSDGGTVYVNSSVAIGSSRFWLVEDEWPEPGRAQNGNWGSYFGNSAGQNDCYDSTDQKLMPAPSGAGEWMELDITGWVQGWFEDDGANHGMLFRAHERGDWDSVTLALSEYTTDTSLRPKLLVTIPEPATMGLLALGFLPLLRRRKR